MKCPSCDYEGQCCPEHGIVDVNVTIAGHEAMNEVLDDVARERAKAVRERVRRRYRVNPEG